MIVKKNMYDYFVNIICIVLLISMVIYLMVEWNNISDTVPAHYNSSGQIDRYGSKFELLIVPIIAWLVFGIISLIEHFPNIWNTGVVVNERNKEKVYRITKTLVVTTKLEIVVIFVYISYVSANGNSLPTMFNIVSVTVIMLTILINGIRLFKNR